MNALKRLWTLFMALFNKGLDAAENQIDITEQIIRDMDSKIKAADDSLTDIMARLELIKADEQHAQSEAEKWEGAALEAHGKGDTALAEDCAKRSAEFREKETMFEGQIAQLESQVQALSAQVEDSYTRRNKAASDVKMIRAQMDISNASMKVASAVTELNTDDSLSTIGKIKERAQLQSAKAASMIKTADKRSGADLDRRVAEMNKGKAGGSALDAILAKKATQG